jgi:hypothetical protein
MPPAGGIVDEWPDDMLLIAGIGLPEAWLRSNRFGGAWRGKKLGYWFPLNIRALHQLNIRIFKLCGNVISADFVRFQFGENVLDGHLADIAGGWCLRNDV